MLQPEQGETQASFTGIGSRRIPSPLRRLACFFRNLYFSVFLCAANMPPLRRAVPPHRQEYASQLAGLFQDIQKKCDGGELSTKPLDLRGLVASVRLMQTGLEGNRALELGLVNKSFDDFEKQLVTDVIRTRLPETLTTEDVFA